jgi:hypothetical protein
MLDLLIQLIHAIVEVLRKLWQRLTGRVPVPVRVRARCTVVGDRFPFSPWSVNRLSDSPFDDARRTRW